jgi:hypothetical protein
MSQPALCLLKERTNSFRLYDSKAVTVCLTPPPHFNQACKLQRSMWQAIANPVPCNGHAIRDLNNKLKSGLGDQPFWLKPVIVFLRFSEHKHKHILFIVLLGELLTYCQIGSWLPYNVGCSARYLQCESWLYCQMPGLSHGSNWHCVPSLGSL